MYARLGRYPLAILLVALVVLSGCDKRLALPSEMMADTLKSRPPSPVTELDVAYTHRDLFPKEAREASKSERINHVLTNADLPGMGNRVTRLAPAALTRNNLRGSAQNFIDTKQLQDGAAKARQTARLPGGGRPAAIYWLAIHPTKGAIEDRGTDLHFKAELVNLVTGTVHWDGVYRLYTVGDDGISDAAVSEMLDRLIASMLRAVKPAS